MSKEIINSRDTAETNVSQQGERHLQLLDPTDNKLFIEISNQKTSASQPDLKPLHIDGLDEGTLIAYRPFCKKNEQHRYPQHKTDNSWVHHPIVNGIGNGIIGVDHSIRHTINGVTAPFHQAQEQHDKGIRDYEERMRDRSKKSAECRANMKGNDEMGNVNKTLNCR